MQQQPDTPGIQSLITGRVLNLLASAGAVFAWSKWYSPPPAPASISQYIHGAVNRLGSNASSGKSPYTVAAELGSHGLSSHKGSIGLLAAIVVAAAVLLSVNRRMRPVAALVALAAATGMLLNGITALIPAAHAMTSWSNLASGDESFAAIAASSASHSITIHSFLPSFGASIGGLVALIGCIFMAFGGIRSSIAHSRQLSPAPPYPPPEPPTAIPAARRTVSLPELSVARRCRSCNRKQPADAQFCGFCGVTLLRPGRTGDTA